RLGEARVEQAGCVSDRRPRTQVEHVLRAEFARELYGRLAGRCVQVSSDDLAGIHPDVAPQRADLLVAWRVAVEHHETGAVEVHDPSSDDFSERGAPQRAQEIRTPLDLIYECGDRDVESESSEPLALSVQR